MQGKKGDLYRKWGIRMHFSSKMVIFKREFSCIKPSKQLAGASDMFWWETI